MTKTRGRNQGHDASAHHKKVREAPTKGSTKRQDSLARISIDPAANEERLLLQRSSNQISARPAAAEQRQAYMFRIKEA